MPEDGVECESFSIISLYHLQRFIFCWWKKKYLKTYLDNFAYKVADNQMADYLDDNLFETDED